jgi:hypothetical protein
VEVHALIYKLCGMDVCRRQCVCICNRFRVRHQEDLMRRRRLMSRVNHASNGPFVEIASVSKVGRVETEAVLEYY